MASLSNPSSAFSDWSRSGHVTQDRSTRAKEFFLEMLKENLFLPALCWGQVQAWASGESKAKRWRKTEARGCGQGL